MNDNRKYISEEFSINKTCNQYQYLSNGNFFTPEDIIFICKQMKTDMNFRLDKSLVKQKTIIPIDSLLILRKEKERSHEFWKRFKVKYSDHEYCSISMPLFSVDKKTAIISFGCHCGSLCGNGEVAVYKFAVEKWKKIEVLEIWMS